jgi:hypothetical protein
MEHIYKIHKFLDTFFGQFTTILQDARSNYHDDTLTVSR